MKKEDILALPIDQLYDDFIEKVLTTPAQYHEIMKELISSERYTNDFKFRIHVQTADNFLNASLSDQEKVFEISDELIERAKVLEMYELVNLNYHILGIAYKQVGYPERALECFFHILSNEKKLKMKKRLSSIVYYFIAHTHMTHQSNEDAIRFFRRAMDLLEETKEFEPRYETKKKMYTGIVIPVLDALQRTEEMDQYIDILMEGFQDKTQLNPVYSCGMSIIIYDFANKRYDEARKTLHEILDTFKDYASVQLDFLKLFFVMAVQHKLDLIDYREEVDMAIRLGDSPIPYINFSLNSVFHEYYLRVGDREGAYNSLYKAYKFLDEDVTRNLENRASSFKLIEQKFSIEESITLVQSKNQELKLVTEEAIRNKNIAENAVRRLSIINQLGKKLTVSLDVDDIIRTVFHYLKENLSMDTFLLMIKDEETNQLKSLIFYSHGVEKEPLLLDADTENSAFVHAFRENEMIVINDYQTDYRFRIKGTDLSNISSRSVVMLPLSVENEVLGVCSIQDDRPNVYDAEQVEFLSELMPYLTIALNNAIKSRALELEIYNHKVTQSELRNANNRLEQLSYLDGLTQISNRRDFENRVLGLLERSKETAQPISIYMFDIDHFKYFNDTYGHLEGDEALKAVAKIVRKHFDAVDGLSARFGGEEFIAASIGLNEEESIALGNAIREEVYSLGIVNEKAPLGKLSISIGIAHSNGVDRSKKSALMRWADISLYHAKNSGKNRVILKVVTPDEEPPEGLE